MTHSLTRSQLIKAITLGDRNAEIRKCDSIATLWAIADNIYDDREEVFASAIHGSK